MLLLKKKKNTDSHPVFIEGCPAKDMYLLDKIQRETSKPKTQLHNG